MIYIEEIHIKLMLNNLTLTQIYIQNHNKINLTELTYKPSCKRLIKKSHKFTNVFSALYF